MVYWPLSRREDGWLTTREAAAVLELSASTVRPLAHRGVLQAEGEGWLQVRGGRSRRSLLAASVTAYLPTRQDARETRAAEQQARAEHRAWAGPPDEDQDWISVDQAADLLGLSPFGSAVTTERRTPPRGPPPTLVDPPA